MNKTLKKVIIVCDENAIIEKYNKYFFYIGVEKGCLNLIKNKFPIDLAISDFDSVDNKELELIKNKSKRTIVEKTNKDLIDGELAILEALKTDIKNIELFLPINNRVDMMFTSVYFANKYKIKVIINNDSLIEPIEKTKILKYEQYKKYKYVSLIAITESLINLHNLKYDAKNLKLSAFSSHGISNELVSNKDAIIEISNGECILFMIKE